MLADVYLVMCHDDFKLASMPRALHSLPVGAHFLERVSVTYVHTSNIIALTQSKCTQHLTVLTTDYDCFQSICYLLWPLGVLTSVQK